MSRGEKMSEQAERLLKVITDSQLSYAQLEKMTGIAKSSIQRYATGTTKKIPVDAVKLIADATNASAAWIMGWEEKYPEPNITDDYITFPILGDIAAGYDHIAVESWEGDTVDIPTSYLKGRKQSDFFVLRVKGDSMFPTYCDGDLVVVLKQSTLNYSGQIGAVLYDDDCATLKRVDYCTGEDWMKLVPINPNYPPAHIENEALEHCRIMGIPWVLVREINN